ncbi:hypothetical protein RclHR1_09260002 [Rhizophagus clarus]|uniref:Uncharacterized protein n=1 Tax=Rhizophagus clarus TaxID=94130 RepID=A0A2Z6S3L8_9GLOM|nr:hypothetical protein RclHR1_09260002 [Rhizophagus clarus]
MVVDFLISYYGTNDTVGTVISSKVVMQPKIIMEIQEDQLSVTQANTNPKGKPKKHKKGKSGSAKSCSRCLLIMNEFLSEEIPYSDIPHNVPLTINVCKELRPKISNDLPKLLADLITKCLDVEIENKELYYLLWE